MQHAGKQFKSLNIDTSKELYDVMGAVNQLQVTNESDQIALNALIHKLSDLSKLRTKRIELANESLPPQLKGLLIFMSLVQLGGFMVLCSEFSITGCLMLGCVTLALHLLYLIISDLDHPFEGQWHIKQRPLYKLHEELSNLVESDSSS